MQWDVERAMRKSVCYAALLALASALAYNWYFSYDYVHVGIEKGVLRGFNTTTWRGAGYLAFKGIPYARPPLGELRFKGPEEESSWTGVRDAVSHGSVCPQEGMISGLIWGDEDCLFLNVYTPSLEAEPLPVMVWIHGGAYLMGSGNDDIYGPDYFMESGVVLVTINYRLGALGFLSTGDDEAPGNAGLKDQVAALRWVRRNIAKFAGDPDNVTIFGESAGGASVHYHLLSPMSSGLFARAIGQSGSALLMWALAENVTGVTMRLAEGLGAGDLAGDTNRALEFLKTASYKGIVRTQTSLTTPEEERIRMSYLFVPAIEKGVKSEEVFLPDYPLKILESGNYNKVPYITGYNSHEGYFLYKEMVKPESINAATEDTERFVPYDIKNPQLRAELAVSIRDFYFNNETVTSEDIGKLIDLNTDSAFVVGTLRATKLQLERSDAPIYFYVFSYDGGLNFLKFVFNIKLPGAAHADDLGYLFYHNRLFWRKPAHGSEDEHVIHTMIRLWTNFAKHGDPTPPGDPLAWKPLTIGKFNYLNISGYGTELGENPDQKRARFWTDAYEKDAAIQQRLHPTEDPIEKRKKNVD